jgi:uncharacterized SAM-binding protein YcdF (DUF218 family)
MYYVKHLTCSSLAHSWEPSRALTTLDFTPLLHRSQLVASMDELRRKALADAAAAAITQVHTLAPLPEDYIIELMNYCHFAVQDVGYSVETHDGLEPVLSTGGGNLLVVMGCQNLPLLHARVNAAIRLLSAAGMTFEVVFAGFNPSAGAAPARIINEAKEARAYFDEYVQKDPGLKMRIGLRQWTETESADTRGNIRHFLDSPFLNGAGTSRLFLVSSTFHLMRIAVELESYSSELLAKGVATVVLVGAESPFTREGMQSRKEYLRSLAFEVYYDVLKRAGRKAATS